MADPLHMNYQTEAMTSVKSDSRHHDNTFKVRKDGQNVSATKDNDDDNNDNNDEDEQETLSDIPLLRRTHTTLGYRDGLTAGKATIMQSSFDSTFPLGGIIGWRAGRILGVFEGYLACPSLHVAPGLEGLVRKQYATAKGELDARVLLGMIGEGNEREKEDGNDGKDDRETAAEKAILDLDFTTLALTSTAEGGKDHHRDGQNNTTASTATTNSNNNDNDNDNDHPPASPAHGITLESLTALHPQLNPILSTISYWEGTALGITKTWATTREIHEKEQSGEAWRDLVKDKRSKDGYMPGDSSGTGFGESGSKEGEERDGIKAGEKEVRSQGQSLKSGTQDSWTGSRDEEGYGGGEGVGWTTEREKQGTGEKENNTNKVAGKPEVGTVGTWEGGGCMERSRAYWSRWSRDEMDDVLGSSFSVSPTRRKETRLHRDMIFDSGD